MTQRNMSQIMAGSHPAKGKKKVTLSKLVKSMTQSQGSGTDDEDTVSRPVRCFIPYFKNINDNKSQSDKFFMPNIDSQQQPKAKRQIAYPSHEYQNVQNLLKIYSVKLSQGNKRSLSNSQTKF